jgi:hypothetical protein
LRKASVRIDKVLRGQLKQARELLDDIECIRKQLEDALEDLEANDRLSNLEIQDLMSAFNQAEVLAATILLRRDETASAVLRNID